MGNPGVKGGNNNKDGKNGLNKVVLVPVGTAFRNTHTRQIVAQLTQENQLFLAAKGGAGGKGNAYFKSAENQTPQVAEAGGEGESFELIVGKQLLNLSIGMSSVPRKSFKVCHKQYFCKTSISRVVDYGRRGLSWISKCWEKHSSPCNVQSKVRLRIL